MRLSVSHKTHYHFDQPMRSVTQSLRLWPSRFEGQAVIDWSVHIADAVRGAGFRTGAGDWIETSTVAGPVSDLVVEVTVDLAVRDAVSVEDREAPRRPTIEQHGSGTPNRALPWENPCNTKVLSRAPDSAPMD